MIDDVVLEGSVRRALEEPPCLGSVRLPELQAFAGQVARSRRRKRWAWQAAGLVAASWAIAVIMSRTLLTTESVEVPVVDGTIAVLCAMDGLDSSDLAGAASSGELLQAWQDAPCGDLL